jgi:protein disulfide-isomerase A6
MFASRLILAALIGVSHGFYHDGAGGVVFESAADFKEQVFESDAPWLIQFFVQFSHESEMLVPEWEKAARALSGIVNVATVDVVTREDISSAFGIHNNADDFPYVRFFRGPDKMKPLALTGPFTAEGLVTSTMQEATKLALDRVQGKIFETAAFAKPKRAAKPKIVEPIVNSDFSDPSESEEDLGKVVRLNDTDYDNVKNTTSSDIWLILFEAPGNLCMHCKELMTEFQAAAQQVHNLLDQPLTHTSQATVLSAVNFRFGVVDVSQNAKFGTSCSVPMGLIPALRVMAPPVVHANGSTSKECVTYEHATSSTSSPHHSSGVNQISSMALVSFALDLLEGHYELLNAAAVGVAAATASVVPLQVPVPQLTAMDGLEDRCGVGTSTTTICLVCALPHILDSGKEGRLAYLETIRGLMRTLRRKHKPVSVMWYEGGAQPKLEAVTQLTFGFPAVVAVHPQKRLFAVMQGGFAASAVVGFVDDITNGKQRTTPLQGLLQIKTTEPWDGKDGVVESDEPSLADIMGDDEDEDE